MNTPANRIDLNNEGNICITFPPDLGKHSKARDITGAKYDKANRYWVIPQKYLLATVKTFPGFALSSDVQTLMTHYTMGEAASKATSSSIVYGGGIDVVNGRKLFSHQKEAVYSILKQRRVILAHDMGLGKTTSALIAGKLTGLPIYVIALRSLHTMWLREANLLGVPIQPLISWSKIPHHPDGDFYCILDEAQALQSMKAKQTQDALDFCNSARYVVALTGTPVKNGKPSNLFGLLCAIKHPLSFKQKVYKKEFGASNLTNLYAATKGSILFKRVTDCIDLPEKIRTLRTADLTPEAQETYNRVFNDLRAKWQLRVNNNEIMSSNEKLVIFTQLRHAASRAKLHTANLMAEELEDNKTQAVFFVSFTDSANRLTEMLSKFSTVGKITGEVNQSERQKAIDTFQAGQSRFIVATYGSGGVGIPLHSAAHVILLDRPWTSSDCFQAEARCYRIGQKNTVFVDWIQQNGIDQHIDALLLKKQRNISSILTGSPTELPLEFDVRSNMDDIFNEIFK